MFASKYLLAIALLSMPPDGEEAFPFDDHPGVGAALQTLAVEWEVLDPREIRYVMARSEDLPSDLNLLRRRYHDLVDAPPACDAERFPPRTTINEFLAFNRTFRQNVDARLSAQPSHWWDLGQTLQETDQLYQVWDAARDARCEYYYVTVRRQALKRLRELLGEQAYYAGKLPPHVPVWRFAMR